MSEERIREVLKFYEEHSDQEFAKKVLDALRRCELTEDELVVIGDWIAEHAKSKKGNKNAQGKCARSGSE